MVTQGTSAASGTFSWTIPNTITNSALVRVSDSTNISTNDISNAAFTIKAPSSITVVSPNGGESWVAGSQHSIIWNSASITKVKVEYSSNNGTSWSVITDSTLANAGNIGWVVPNIITSQAKVRVSDYADASVFDINDVVFNIIPSFITVLEPNGAEQWQAGFIDTIKWSQGGIDTVKIEYSTNNGSSWILIAPTISASASQYLWSVPITPTTQALVKLSNKFNSQTKDSSNGIFEIFVPSVNVISPNGGEVLLAGRTDTITWSSRAVANVKIEYSTDNGTSWSSVVASTPASAGKFAWVIPASFTAQGRVRISNAADALINDMSNNSFSIPLLTLTAPNGGETWLTGTQHDITWSQIGISLVKIELSTNNGSSWSVLKDSVVSSPYAWSIPVNLPASAQNKVRISGTLVPDVKDSSENTFTLNVLQPSLSLVSPNGGENWAVGTVQQITWSSINIATVTIDYSSDDGASWSSVTSGTDAAAGSFDWTVPIDQSPNSLIRIASTADTSINDISNAPFSVAILPIGTFGWRPNILFGSSLVSVKTVTEDIVWAAGANGEIYRTTDVGLTWEFKVTVPASVNAIEAIDENQAWVGTSTANATQIYRTTNGGISWQLQFSQAGGKINSVKMFSATNGVAVGDPVEGSWTVLKTANGGSTWTVSNSPPQASTEKGLSNSGFWVNSSIGWFGTTNGRIYSTKNGGSSWKSTTTPFTNSYGVYFESSANGVAGGSNGTLAVSTDGGNSWSSTSTGIGKNVQAVHGVGSTVWALRDTAIYSSTNSGATWNLQYTGRDSLTHLSMFSASGKYVGYCVSATGRILQYSDYVNSQTTLQIPVSSGWNVISAPLVVSDYRVSVVYPGAASVAYGYSPSGYASEDTMKEGFGYWLKFSSAQTVSMTGFSIDADTIDLYQGWNLIGSVSTTIPTSSVTTIPSGLINSAFFKYNGSWQTSTEIVPGRGYFVKVASPAKMVFTGSVIAPKAQPGSVLTQFASGSDKFVFSDPDGNKQTLYVRNEFLNNQDLSIFQLPPKPPLGNFDVRFENQNMMSVPDKDHAVHVELQASSFPVAVHVESEQNNYYEVLEEINHQTMNKKIVRSGEQIQITNPKITGVMLNVISGDHPEIPQQFALKQNFPNPFNPSTTIEYDIARPSLVTLEVSNVLGQNVMTVVNGTKQPGSYTVEVNGEKLSSGIYFYQLKAKAENGEFIVLTKKMVLIR